MSQAQSRVENVLYSVERIPSLWWMSCHLQLLLNLCLLDTQRLPLQLVCATVTHGQEVKRSHRYANAWHWQETKPPPSQNSRLWLRLNSSFCCKWSSTQGGERFTSESVSEEQDVYRTKSSRDAHWRPPPRTPVTGDITVDLSTYSAGTNPMSTTMDIKQGGLNHRTENDGRIYFQI